MYIHFFPRFFSHIGQIFTLQAKKFLATRCPHIASVTFSDPGTPKSLIIHPPVITLMTNLQAKSNFSSLLPRIQFRGNWLPTTYNWAYLSHSSQYIFRKTHTTASSHLGALHDLVAGTEFITLTVNHYVHHQEKATQGGE